MNLRKHTILLISWDYGHQFACSWLFLGRTPHIARSHPLGGGGDFVHAILTHMPHYQTGTDRAEHVL